MRSSALRLNAARRRRSERRAAAARLFLRSRARTSLMARRDARQVTIRLRSSVKAPRIRGHTSSAVSPALLSCGKTGHRVAGTLSSVRLLVNFSKRNLDTLICGAQRWFEYLFAASYFSLPNTSDVTVAPPCRAETRRSPRIRSRDARPRLTRPSLALARTGSAREPSEPAPCRRFPRLTKYLRELPK